MILAVDPKWQLMPTRRKIGREWKDEEVVQSRYFTLFFLYFSYIPYMGRIWKNIGSNILRGLQCIWHEEDPNSGYYPLVTESYFPLQTKYRSLKSFENIYTHTYLYIETNIHILAYWYNVVWYGTRHHYHTGLVLVCYPTPRLQILPCLKQQKHISNIKNMWSN